jgi:hypothetical protein
MTIVPLPRRNVRLAGIGLGVVLGGLGGLKLWQGKPSSAYFLASCVLVCVVAVFLPSLLRPIVRAAMAVGSRIIWITTQAALMLAYFLIVTPTAVVARLLGTSFTDTDFSKRRESYWIMRDAGTRPAADYDKQY